MTVDELKANLGYLQRVRDLAASRYQHDHSLHHEVRVDLGYIVGYAGQVMIALERELKGRKQA